MARPTVNRAAPEPRIYNYVRFSTPRQQWGDSERQQNEAAEHVARELAEQRGLRVDDELDMRDPGLSGYHGEHLERGRLGDFLTMVEDGQIASGSVLVVYDLDRFSRGDPLDSAVKLRNLARSGVSIVTASGRQEYNADNADELSRLVISVIEFYRAANESDMKARRSKAAQASKRARARDEGHIITSKVPLWVNVEWEWDDRKKQMVPARLTEHPEAAPTIRKLFDLAEQGYGAHNIARILNDDPNAWAPEYGGKTTSGWFGGTVHHVLRNPAVHGFHQPHRDEWVRKEPGGRKVRQRVPDGPPLTSYYPVVVSEDQFRRVQRLLDQRAARQGHDGGRTGSFINIVSRGLARCANCNSTMSLENKGSGKLKYLVCSAALRGRGCTVRRVPYAAFERELLERCRRGLDVADLLDDETQQSELAQLQAARDARESERAEAEARAQRFIRAIGDQDDDAVAQQLRQQASAETERATERARQRDELDAEIEALRGAPERVEQGLADVRSLSAKLDELAGEGRRDYRLRLREALRQLVEVIEVDPEAGRAEVRFGPAGAARQRAEGRPFARTRFTLRWQVPQYRR